MNFWKSENNLHNALKNLYNNRLDQQLSFTCYYNIVNLNL